VEVQLRRGGVSYGAGELPTGVYTVQARFEGKPLAPMGAVTVLEGGLVTLNCQSSFSRCNSRQSDL